MRSTVTNVAFSGIGHRSEFGLAPDPDVAEAIRLGRVEQREIGTYRGDDDDRIIGSERIADDLPVRSRLHQIAADDAANRHERNALLTRRETRQYRRTRRVHQSETAGPHALGETGRSAGLAQGHGAGFDRSDEARADQQIGLYAADGHADEVKIFRGQRR